MSEETLYPLLLTVEELTFIYVVMSAVGGCPDSSPRKLADAITGAMDENLDTPYWVTEHFDINNDLMFFGEEEGDIFFDDNTKITPYEGFVW